MKRYFSVVEEVRIEYEMRTTDEQDIEIDKLGSYQKWLENRDLGYIFNQSAHNQILDYIYTDKETILEE